VSMCGNVSEMHQFIAGRSEMFFLPELWLIALENTGDADAEIIIAITTESPEVGRARRLA
jgi:hypothetical protein